LAKTILIVDDSEGIRLIVKIALKSVGYEVIEGTDGVDALTKLTTLTDQKIHLIICDLNMPNMDGITFVREVKKMDDYKFVPIIMLTTDSHLKNKLEGHAAGAKAWMVKPFQPDQMLSVVSKLISP
jgi:two-component system, chemotaxis family, chemotaxis protein CheY